MRVLRFLRPVRSSATALDSGGSADALGLDAFATEAPPPASGAASTVNAERLVAAVIVLAAVALIEAVPTLLWIQNRFAPAPQSVATVAAPAITPAPLPIEAQSAAPPCAPAASPQSTVTPAVVTAAAEAAPNARATASGLVAGLVAITAPVPMHVYAAGRLVGTTEAESILLPVGEHDIELVSEAVGFRARRTVTVQAGRTSPLRIDAPRVPVHINAVPWAEVWIDNQRVGETPIGNLPQPIGSHEIVFRHPELGERRMVVMVTMKEPARISMDLRKR